MRVLYKYYSALPKDYILNPTIKLTPPLGLNDPFESIIPRNLLNFMKNDKELRSLTNRIKAELNIEDDELIRMMENVLAHCGIVSLSETQRNLLMWAHYGAQHKGICIGYKENLFEETLPILGSDIRGDAPYFDRPIKVNYDSTRFDPDGSAIYKYKEQSIIFNILAHVLTTKSDDWIYEKEHRYIVPIIWGDCYYSSKMYFEQDKKNKIVDLNDGEFITYVPRMYKINSIKNENMKLLSADNTYIMKRITSKSIESIYFGCKASSADVYKFLELIKSNHETLGHIKVYKFKESDTRFELETELVYLPYKSASDR